jgi:protein-S-isoprenylcysteine O-methyltransferase Ste14
MSKILLKLGIVKNSIVKDIFYFAIPALIVFITELIFCSRDGFTNFWISIWNLIKYPNAILELSAPRIVGYGLIFSGFVIMIAGQLTLSRNYSGTVVIKKDHKLITSGLYRYTRNPIYLGGIFVLIGIAVYTPSLFGLITSFFIIPIALIRINLEEKLLKEQFNEDYSKYMEKTKRLIPFIY